MASRQGKAPSAQDAEAQTSPAAASAKFPGKFQKGRPRLFGSGKGRETTRGGRSLAGVPRPEGGTAQGAWFSSAAVTMTSIQMRMASGLGATM